MNQEIIEDISSKVNPKLGDHLTWRWEPQFSVMLSEFARDKIDGTLIALRNEYQHEWDKTSIKKAPPILKEQLGSFSNLIKEQRIFSTPATEEMPAIVGILWPWGHGGTYSLRFTVLKESYIFPEEKPLPKIGGFKKFLSRFKSN